MSFNIVLEVVEIEEIIMFYLRMLHAGEGDDALSILLQDRVVEMPFNNSTFCRLLLIMKELLW